MTDGPRYHFITGLPRSGSTLLSAILRQNPKATAGMTSPVGAITNALRIMMTQNTEIRALVDDGARSRILRGIFDGYYSDHQDKEVIFDTNRGWAGRIPELLHLFPEVKLIATVRDPAWVFDSVETIIRKNPIRQSSMVKAGANIEARAEAMMSNEGLIGSPLGHLQEAVFGPDSHRLLLIDYRALCLAPDKALAGIYRFIGEEAFEHDFQNVEYQQEEFDAALNTPGLHTVRGQVEYKERPTILPPGIFAKLSARAFWNGDIQSKAARIIIPEKTVEPLAAADG
ncbi:MAG: sulfotransferase [Pseudomonadota bacterium]